MSKEKLNNLTDKVIGKVGPLRVPAYWMNRLLKDIGGWISKTEDNIATVDSKVDDTKASIPTKVSQLENDAEYAEKSLLPVSKILQSPYIGSISLNDRDVAFAMDVLPEDFQGFDGINNVGEATLVTFLDKKSSTRFWAEAVAGQGPWIVEAGHDFGLYKITIGYFGISLGGGYVLIDKVKPKLGWAHATFVVDSDSEQLLLSVVDNSSYYNGNFISDTSHSPGVGEHSYLIKIATTDSNGNILLNYKFFGPKLKKLQLSDVSILDTSSLADRTYLEEVIFPESLSAIKRRSFYNSPALKELRFPGSIKTLENCCFEGVECPIFFENSCELQEIGRFSNVERVEVCFNKDVVFDKNSSIEDGAMHKCKINGTLYIDTRIADSWNGNIFLTTFGNSDIGKIVIGENVDYIGWGAFNGSIIKEVQISSLSHWMSVRRSPTNTDGLFNAKIVLIDGEVPVNITIPEGVAEIKDAAFAMLSTLKSVISNGEITKVGYSPFRYCKNLEYIDFSNQTIVPEVKIDNISNLYIAEVPHIVPDNLYDEWISATNWATIGDYIIKKSDWDAQQTTE